MELWYERNDSPGSKYCIRVGRPLFSAEGSGARVEVFESEELGRILCSDDCIALTEKESFALREMLAHPALSVHPRARSVLVAGGGDGSLASEILRYPEIEKLVILDDDESYAEAAARFFPEFAAALKDPRLSFLKTDAAGFIRDSKDRFDLIVLELRGETRVLEQSFYCDCFRLLSGDGILLCPAGSLSSPGGRRCFTGIAGRLKRLFPIYRPYRVEPPAGGCCLSYLGLASKRYDPVKDFSAQRWEGRGMETRYYDARLHGAAFALPRYAAELLRNA